MLLTPSISSTSQPRGRFTLDSSAGFLLPVGRAHALNSFTSLIQMAFSLRLLVVAAGLLWVALLWTRGLGFARLPHCVCAGWSSQEYSIFRLADRVLSARPTCQWGPVPLFILSWSLSPSRRIFMRRSLPLITSEAGEACVFIVVFSIAFIVF